MLPNQYQQCDIPPSVHSEDCGDYLNSTYLPTYGGGWIRMAIWGEEITQSKDSVISDYQNCNRHDGVNLSVV
jgi:hypothetical protein